MSAQKKAKDIDIDFGLDSLIPEQHLKNKGIYYITGEIEDNSLLDIQQDLLLKHLDPEWKHPVQIFVNSVGGSASETWALVDLLSWIRMPVRTIGLGYCASAGAILLATGDPGHRIITENTAIMIHGPSIGSHGGTHQQMVADSLDMQLEYNRHVQFWKKHSKFNTDSTVQNQLLNGIDVTVDAKGAIELGIVDVIIGQQKDLTIGKKKTKTKKKSKD